MDADKIPLTPELLALHNLLATQANPHCARVKPCAAGCQYPRPCDAQTVPPPRPE